MQRVRQQIKSELTMFTNKQSTVRPLTTTNASLRQINRWMLILRPAIVTATLGAALLIYPGWMIDRAPIVIILAGTYLLTLLYVIAHRLTGVNLPLLATEITFDLFTITVIIHYTGNIESSFVGFYFLSILCASFFFSRRITIGFSVAAALFYAAYTLAYVNISSAHIGTIAKYNVTIQLVMYCILMIAVGILASTFSARIIKKDTALISALRLLKEARLDTSDILQSMTNGLLTVTMTGYIVYSNRAAEEILDLIGEPVQGRRYDAVLGERCGEMVKVIQHELTVTTIISDHEIAINNRAGRPKPIGMTVVPLYDMDRSRRGIIINFKDLVEKNRLMEMVRQADRMAAIGELSASIAHEIRNPLASICNAVELLKDSMPEHEDARVGKLLRIIEKESERLQRISSDFLKFARVKDPEIAVINLHGTIGEVLALIENDPRKTVDVFIRNKVREGLTIQFDEDHLRQVIINIIINSLDVLEGNGEIVIETGLPERLEPGFLRLIVYDTGPGFPEEAAGRMFEPFYSTKKDGTGLGLALVRKLVIANNGRVLAQNREGAGAEISLDIPLGGDA
jgi:two-component system, NtrC family, sensor histidine kinase PilS